MKINITFNGTSHDIATDSTITQALAVLTIASNTEANKFVIALNQTFVPRSQYSTTQLPVSYTHLTLPTIYSV